MDDTSLRQTLRSLFTSQKLAVLANKHDVPYQSLLKIFLAERIKQEFSS